MSGKGQVQGTGMKKVIKMSYVHKPTSHMHCKYYLLLTCNKLEFKNILKRKTSNYANVYFSKTRLMF